MPLLLTILEMLIRELGPELVQGRLDAFKAARAAADAAEDVKFGPKA